MSYRTGRVNAPSEVNALDGHVRLENKFVASPDLDNRAVVADAELETASTPRNPGAQPAHEFGLSSEHG